MFRKKIQAASGSFQYRRPTQILRPHHALRTKCFASQQNTQPCAIEIPKRMAHTAPCANRPTSPTSPTSPTFFAPTLCIAQCALPANRTHSPVLLKFQSTWLSLHPVPLVRTSPYKSVQVRTSPYSLARTLCPAQCALPA